jgi:hypothetical protein
MPLRGRALPGRGPARDKAERAEMRGAERQRVQKLQPGQQDSGRIERHRRPTHCATGGAEHH